MRILHVVGHLGGRGGAEEHLRGVVERLGAAGHEVHAVAGEITGTDPPCRATRVAGLEARHAVPVDLEPSVRAFRPDVIHLQNIMNPAVLEWAAGRPALVTVQDHRSG